MARTTEDRVQLIIQYDTTVIPDIQPFIDDANIMVTAIVATDDTPSAASLELIERYLAAHLIAITDPRVDTEKVKSLQTKYQYLLDKGLGITHFGTTAMAMDFTGRLAAFNTRLTKGGGLKQFFWAGEA